MKTEPILLAYLVALSLASGFLLGLGRDLLLFVGRVLTRLFLKHSPRKTRTYKLMQAVQDLWFCAIVGCVLTVLLFYCSEGRFRFFSVLALGLGYMLYRQSIGRFWGRYSVRFSETLAEAVSRFLVRFSTPIFRFLVWMLRCVSRPIRACYRKIKDGCLQKYRTKRIEELRKISKKGFVNI